MSKLIQKHMQEPTEKNLEKIKKHAAKHPFSFLTITKDEAEYLSEYI